MKQAVLMLTGVLCITVFYTQLVPYVNHTTVALTYLLVPLVAGTYGFIQGVAASVLCGFCFNYFFLPPVGTLTIHDPQNLAAFAVFLITGVAANHLSSSARRKAEESERRRQDVGRLYEVSKVILSELVPETAWPMLPQRVIEIFGFDACAIARASETRQWKAVAPTAEGGSIVWHPEMLDILDSVSKTGIAWEAKDASGRTMICLPLRAGHENAGALMCASPKVERTTIEAIAGLVSVALERMAILEELSRTEALKQSNSLKSAILASVSHDLRTPLTSIRAAVENLMSTDVEWEEGARREFHSVIKEEVDRLSRLVQNLLEMARIDAGECQPARDWSSISDLVEDVLARTADALAYHQVRVDIPQAPPQVLWDERLVGQALANVLDNAGRYSPSGSEVRLRVELAGEEVLIHVEDQGPGIPAEEVPRIFERFYRGRAAGKNGTGMGLAIARGILEAHGGTISVESAPGRGSTFTVAIPAQVRSVGALET